MAAGGINLEFLQLARLANVSIESYHSLHAQLLILADRSLERSPVFVVLCIYICAVNYKQVSNRPADRTIFAVQIHYEMQGRLAFAVSLVWVCASEQHRLDETHLELEHGQVEGTAVDAAARVNVDVSAAEQDIGNLEVLLKDRETKRGALIFVKQIWVRTSVLEKALHDADVAFGCRVVERGAHAAVNVVHIENHIRKGL